MTKPQPRLSDAQRQILDLMRDGRERTTGDVATRTGLTIGVSFAALRGMQHKGLMVAERFQDFTMWRIAAELSA